MFLFMLLATFSLASAQTIDIKGTVIDENGEPVIGASVMIKGTLKGDITDVSGRFSLGGVKTTDKLAVSCIGMIPVEIDPQAEMRITLKPTTSSSTRFSSWLSASRPNPPSQDPRRS